MIRNMNEEASKKPELIPKAKYIHGEVKSILEIKGIF